MRRKDAPHLMLQHPEKIVVMAFNRVLYRVCASSCCSDAGLSDRTTHQHARPSFMACALARDPRLRFGLVSRMWRGSR